MLVLSRKMDEEIELDIDGHKVKIKVVRIEAKKVRLGIQASKNVTILRSELVDKSSASN